MGQMIELTAADGHKFAAYQAGSDGTTAGLVVVQEIFGVNHHIRTVCDRFAAEGFAVIAPALFDRAERGVELGYDEAGVKEGLALRAKVPEDGTMADIAASAAALSLPSLGIVGYCWGGTIAWWGATKTTTFKAASGWYGGGIAASKDAKTHCPVQLHFGGEDHGIPMTDVEAIRAAQPSVEVYVYEGAGHGFGCDERGSFNQHAYEQARQRTLDFFARHLR